MRPRSRLPVAVLAIIALVGGYFGGKPLLERFEFARAEADVQATRQQLSTVEDLSTVFRHVSKVVEPSVVQIRSIRESRANPDTLRRFFQDRGDLPAPFDNGNGNGNDDQQYEQIGTGSGVIVEATDGYGYIVTNNHVAGGSKELDITLSDGRTFQKAKVLGTDPKSDLAVVQIKADRLIPAKWGNSDELEKGDWVMAFGSPFGYIGSMTHGIVSALNRHDVGILSSSGGYENFIQVDAPINPGNSGGPLVNIRGEIVGINTAIATSSGGFQGIGFAIPSNQAQPIYSMLKDHGKVVRGWLGIKLGSLHEHTGLAASFGYTGDADVLVDQVFPNTPAEGKLKAGDIIISVNGQAVTNAQQLRDRIAGISPDANTTLKVFRDGKEQDIDLKVGTQPDNLAGVMGNNNNNPGNQGPADNEPAKALGLSLQTADSSILSQLSIPGIHDGAVITSVDHGSVAETAGLHRGDVITRVGDTDVHNAHDAAAALQKADLKKGIRLYVNNSQGGEFIVLQSDTTP